MTLPRYGWSIDRIAVHLPFQQCMIMHSFGMHAVGMLVLPEGMHTEMHGVQGGMLHWVLRVEHLAQHLGHLPFPAPDHQCTAVECTPAGDLFVGCHDGAVWHMPVSALPSAPRLSIPLPHIM